MPATTIMAGRATSSPFEAPLLTCEAVIAESCHLLRRIPDTPNRVLKMIERGSIRINLSL